MKSVIYELEENGNITEKAIYTCDSKKALINYIMQYKKNNWNDWMYPETLPGIRESKTVKDHWYFDYNNIVIASYPA